MNTLLTAFPSGSAEGRQGIAICGIPGAAGGDATSERVPTAEIRHALRALASETGQLTGLRGAKLLRPLIAQAHEVLRERLEAGGSVEAYLRDRTRLADSAVIGLLHIASVSTRMRGSNMVAQLAAVAVGGYGRSELAPGSDLDLLFLLPESNQSRAGAVPAATETCINAVIAGLWDLGFVLDHAARSPASTSRAKSLPSWRTCSTGASCGTVSACSARWMPISRASSQDRLPRVLEGRRWLSHGEQVWRRAQ